MHRTFLDEVETNPSYARTERELTGRGRRSAGVVRRGGGGSRLGGACALVCWFASRSHMQRLPVISRSCASLEVPWFDDDGDGYGLRREKPMIK
jgi:hypothetical protein